MFCSQCGNPIPENSAFCPKCGTPVNGQTPTAPVATIPAQPSAAAKAFNDFLAVLKGVFSTDVVKTVGAQAKSTGLEWLYCVILSILSFALATSVNILEGTSQLLKEVAGGFGGQLLEYMEFPFFSFFGASLLIGILVLAAVTGGIWLVAKLVSKKNVSIICTLNLVGAATLPLSICYIANMLLGLIWFPLPIAISVVALIMTLILLYAGFQKLEKPEVSPFYPYAALVAVAVIVAALMSFLLYKAVITGWIEDLTGSILGGLGDLFGQGGLGGLGGLGDLGGLGSLFQ